MGRGTTAVMTKGAKGAKTAAPAKRPGLPAKAVTAKPKGGLPSQKVLHDAAEMFKKLGDPTRLAILHMLKDGEMSVSDICARLDQSQPAVSHHLALLKHAYVVRDRRDGKRNFYRLVNAAVGRQIEGIEALAESAGPSGD